jgi:DNA-binding CsgD family transcriptional regulator
MFRFDLLREQDIAALLNLVGEVTELPADKVIRRTHVLRGLLKLVGGRSAAALEFADEDEGPFARPGSIVNIDYSCEAEARKSELYLIHNWPADPATHDFIRARGQTLTMVRNLDDQDWYNSEHYDIVRKPFDMDHTLYCRLTLPDGQDMAVGIQRCPGDPVFDARDQAMVHLLHTSAPQVYYAPVARSPELEALAPRLQPVLRYLLQGHAEKEVAAKLKLSKHTVHRYTQNIYQELDLHSRGELMAKYARAV